MRHNSLMTNRQKLDYLEKDIASSAEGDASFFLSRQLPKRTMITVSSAFKRRQS